MKLSVVIVNYNVKYFLKQCLTSVYDSQLILNDGSTLELDVWVVDNDSIDGSTAMVKQDFPSVHLIENHTNLGYSKANNQALRQIVGSELILLLNPDTIVEPDTFVQCANFMNEHPDCGGLGVKMIDGNGRFLKESKRGFPSPQAAFFKISGLIYLFPRSKRIAAYYMGHLDPNTTHPVDILCGAFLMFRHEVYQTIGSLDEDYFMYGEDIDFSWRIRQAGYQNYYLPTTRIIHYKGESTKKGSMNYVYTFYNAMSIFVKKYISGRGAKAYSLLIRVAIWMRAIMAWCKRLLKRLAIPALDFLLAYGGFLLLKELWQVINGFPANYYPPTYTTLIIPVYILFLMVSSWLMGGYDRPVRLGRIVRGMSIGCLLLLAFYSLLDESQRYSRMLLLLGSAWTLIGTLIVRLLLSWFHVKGYSLHANNRGNTLIVGSPAETARISNLYTMLGTPANHIETTTETSAAHLQSLIRIHRADVVIFCGHDLDLRYIIELMASLSTSGVDYMIAPSESDYIIGSESILSPENLYLDELNTISTDTSRRTKRLFDLATATTALLLCPLIYWFQRRKRHFFNHCFNVLIGHLTWVGYTGHPGVFSPADRYPNINPDLADKLMLRYMRYYSTSIDLSILLRNWNNL